MVKVTIEMDGKVSVLNGEFFYGFIVNKREAGEIYYSESSIRGNMNPEKFPQILADTTVECLVRIARGDECAEMMTASMLSEYDIKVHENVKKEILARKDSLLRDISRMLQR